MHPDLAKLDPDHEAALRQHASFAWNKAYQMWQAEQRGVDDGSGGNTPTPNPGKETGDIDTKPTPKPTPGDDTSKSSPEAEDEESGGSGFVTFIVVVIILAILGGIAYFLHK